MDATMNNEKIALTLRLNAADIQDFLKFIRFSKFAVEVDSKIEPQESAKISISEDNFMNSIDAEIQAYRDEKRQEKVRTLLKNLIATAPPLPMPEDELMEMIVSETKI